MLVPAKCFNSFRPHYLVMSDRSVGIVLPAYRPDPERLQEYVAGIAERLDPSVIRVEIDAPAPQTRDVLADTVAEVGAVPQRRGKGAAITAGFNQLETDILAFADSDGSVPPASLEPLMEPVKEGEADLAAGSRRHPAADNISHESVVRRLMGDVFAWTARRVVSPPLHDYQCGAKAVTQDAWSTIVPDLQATGYGWDVELIGIAHAQGADIREVPITWEDQPGSTVAPLPTALELARTLARTAWYQHRAGKS